MKRAVEAWLRASDEGNDEGSPSLLANSSLASPSSSASANRGELKWAKMVALLGTWQGRRGARGQRSAHRKTRYHRENWHEKKHKPGA